MPRGLTPFGRDVIIPSDATFTDNREAWLQHVIAAWRPIFARVGTSIFGKDARALNLPVPELPTQIRVSCGKPPTSSWTGCFYPGHATDDGIPCIFVNPVIDDSTRAAGVVVHQLCHIMLGSRRHDLVFRRLSEAVWLIGKPTQTIEGPLFLHVMPAIIDRYGPYPHSALRQIRGIDKKPPGSRLIRVRCLGCGYAMRVTQRWLNIAVPTCPNPRCPEHGAHMEVG